ncbi:hypothetical protein FQN53_005364 [Emmonsiellopsis sp. PD_33]|nr:hypothetical protein FQN53_005364 [Emmonsiellopsis sp. PD_33]
MSAPHAGRESPSPSRLTGSQQRDMSGWSGQTGSPTSPIHNLATNISAMDGIQQPTSTSTSTSTHQTHGQTQTQTQSHIPGSGVTGPLHEGAGVGMGGTRRKSGASEGPDALGAGVDESGEVRLLSNPTHPLEEERRRKGGKGSVGMRGDRMWVG